MQRQRVDTRGSEMSGIEMHEVKDRQNKYKESFKNTCLRTWLRRCENLLLKHEVLNSGSQNSWEKLGLIMHALVTPQLLEGEASWLPALLWVH